MTDGLLLRSGVHDKPLWCCSNSVLSFSDGGWGRRSLPRRRLGTERCEAVWQRGLLCSRVCTKRARYGVARGPNYRAKDLKISLVSKILSVDELVADSVEIRWRIEGEFFPRHDELRLHLHREGDRVRLGRCWLHWAMRIGIPLGRHTGRAPKRSGRLGWIGSKAKSNWAGSAGQRERWKNGSCKGEAG
jgi:hypothetical protein